MEICYLRIILYFTLIYTTMKEKINEKVKQLKTDFEHFLDPLKRGRYTKIGEYQGKGILYTFF